MDQTKDPRDLISVLMKCCLPYAQETEAEKSRRFNLDKTLAELRVASNALNWPLFLPVDSPVIFGLGHGCSSSRSGTSMVCATKLRDKRVPAACADSRLMCPCAKRTLLPAARVGVDWIPNTDLRVG